MSEYVNKKYFNFNIMTEAIWQMSKILINQCITDENYICRDSIVIFDFQPQFDEKSFNSFVKLVIKIQNESELIFKVNINCSCKIYQYIKWNLIYWHYEFKRLKGKLTLSTFQKKSALLMLIDELIYDSIMDFEQFFNNFFKVYWYP